MKIAYVAGAYTAPSKRKIKRNIKAAWKVGFELAKLGYMPIVPHSNSAMMDKAQPYGFWITGDLEILRRAADLVVLVPGWGTSRGTLKEIYVAKRLDIPVYHWPTDRGRLTRIINDHFHN